VDSFEELTPRQRLAERLMLGLRLADGVPAAWLEERLAGDEPLGKRVTDWRDGRLLVEAGGRVRLTEAGFLLSDALFVELL
jgi:oxygen-independent coproporphyrinogen-3 oxidase